MPGETNHPARNSAGFITLGGPASLPAVDRPANHPSTSRRLEHILHFMEEGSPADITKPARLECFDDGDRLRGIAVYDGHFQLQVHVVHASLLHEGAERELARDLLQKFGVPAELFAQTVEKVTGVPYFVALSRQPTELIHKTGTYVYPTEALRDEWELLSPLHGAELQKALQYPRS